MENYHLDLLINLQLDVIASGEILTFQKPLAKMMGEMEFSGMDGKGGSLVCVLT